MIDKLEFLLALAQERHFGRAAAACGTTQPTFSTGIKQLEEMFGTQLVERGSRFRGFTEAGDHALTWARRIVGDSRAMRQDLLSLRHALSGRMRIAVIPTALPLATRLTAAFAARNPEVQLSILSRTSDEILGMLDNLESDAGITYLDNEPLRRVVAIPLFRERLSLVCAETSRFAMREQVNWSELDKHPLCLLTPDMQNRRIVDRALSTAGVTPVVGVESDSMLALLSHLRTGRWDSILPEHWVDTLQLAPGLRTIPIDGPEQATTVGLVLPPRDPPSAFAAALMAEAQRLDRKT